METIAGRQQNAPMPGRARAALYGLMSVVVLTGLVLVILARQALA